MAQLIIRRFCVIATLYKAVDGSPERLATVQFMAKSLKELIERPVVPGRDEARNIYRSRIRNYYRTHLPVLTLYQRWFGSDALAFIEAKMSNDKVALTAVIRRTVKRLTTRLDQVVADFVAQPLEFITQDPGRQYTGNPNQEERSLILFEPTHIYLFKPCQSNR